MLITARHGNDLVEKPINELREEGKPTRPMLNIVSKST
jgi:hypothetical protein